MRAIILIPICAMFLAGCGLGSVSSEVTRFHKGLDLITQKSFVIQPIAEQKNSLEFQSISAYVSEKLQTYGLNPVNSKPAHADYRVQLHFGIDDGKTVVSSSEVYGQTGGGTVQHSGNTSSGESYSGTSNTLETYGVVGTEVSSSIVYTRHFNLDIFDLKNKHEDIPKKIFEGSVKSLGSSNSLAIVHRCLVNALFTDFPGVSGKSQNIRPLLSDCTPSDHKAVRK